MQSSVLIVDDNPAVLSALGQLLEYEVEKVMGIGSPQMTDRWRTQSSRIKVVVIGIHVLVC